MKKVTLLLTTLMLTGLLSVITVNPVRAAKNSQWIAVSAVVLPVGAIAQDDENECSDSNNDGECDPENMNQD